MTHICKKRTSKERFTLERVCGNCLEKLGIHNSGGGFAIIDCNATPKVGDVVHCSKIAGQIGGYLKQIKSINEDSIIVGTAYFDETKDFQFEAAEIFGVVIETYGGFPSYREYVRPTHLRKKKLKESESK